MKLYAAVVISLLAVVGLVTGVFGSIRRGQAMQVRFHKRDLPKQDVHLITSADPSFPETSSMYFKGQSGGARDEFKPFSVFIKNSGNRTVVAYMLVWQLVRKDGTVTTNKRSYSEPGILMGDKMPTDPRFKHTQAIEPEGIKCFSWSGLVGQEEARLGNSEELQSEQRQRSKEASAAIQAELTKELAQATDLTVSLDGVFFDDGTFVGPNTTGFFELMKAMVNAKLDLLRDITEAASQGKDDEVFDAITAKSLDPNVTAPTSPEEYYDYYRKIFASELSGMKNAYGKQRLVPYLTNLQKQSRPVLRKEVWEER